MIDGRIYGIQRARMQQEVDRANDRARGNYGSSLSCDRPISEKKHKICPECSAPVLCATQKCQSCGYMFWERVNGVNVYKKKNNGKRQCPDCNGWLNTWEPVCGCGHHFEPIIVASFEIQIPLPKGITMEQMQNHISGAVRSLYSGLSDDSVDSVKVKNGKTIKIK
ncbi:MAG: hypothetical protein WC919_06025 [Candidatus Paceibacterota bacterium]